MKKRIIMIVCIIILSLVIVKLYQTFAISSIVSGTDNTYNITLNDSDTVSVPAKSSKVIYYQISNTNKGKVKYGVGYTSNNIEVKTYWDTLDEDTGIIDYGENKFVKLKLINNSTSSDTVTLTTILGYEFGGDLIVPSGVTLVSKEVSEKNEIVSEGTVSSSSSTVLGTTVTRANVGTVTFEKDNIVPAGAISPKDISSNGDGSVMMWYTENSDGSYELHMGSENGKVSITNGENLFAYMDKVESLDFSNVDLSGLTSMAYMFNGCTNLKEIKFGNNKLSNITSLYHTFDGTEGLTTIDLSGFDTSNVTNMGSMFKNSSVEYLDLRGFNTSKVTYMKNMFEGCSNLKNVDLRNFDTSKVTTMEGMFRECSSLTSLDLSNFNTSKVTTFAGMFHQCINIKTLNLSGFNTSSLKSMANMFNNCSSLITLDLIGWNTSNVESMEWMFYKCSSLSNLNLSTWNTNKVTNMSGMFSACKQMETIYVSNLWNTSLVTNSTEMFKNCTSLKGGAGTKFSSSYIDKTYARIDGGTSNPGYLTLKAI